MYLHPPPTKTNVDKKATNEKQMLSREKEAFLKWMTHGSLDPIRFPIVVTFHYFVFNS